jgi:hypothetical protein
LCLLILSPAFAQWEPDVRLTNDPADSYLCGQQCIVASGDTLHVIYIDSRSGGFDVYYVRSLDAAVTWDSAVRLSPGDSSSTFSATLGATGSGVHVVWTTSNDQALIYRRSTDCGASWSTEETLVVSANGLFGPFLSADGSDVGLVWGDQRDGYSNGEMYYKQSSDGGLSWTPDTRLTFGPDTCVDKEACLVVAGAYRYIVWTRRHWRTSVSQTWFMRSTDGGANWQPRTRITADTTSQSQPMVAAAGPNVHVCWSDGRPGGYGIWYRRSTDNGATWNAERYLADTTYGSDYPVIAAAGGNVHVAYRAWPGGQFVIEYRNSTDNGQTWAAETALTTAAGMGTSVLAAAGSRAHLLLYDNRDGNFEIYYKRNLTAGGVEERENSEVRRVKSGATVVRGVLFWGAYGTRHTAYGAGLFDMTGRQVMALRPGPNDVSRMSPGVYFLRVGAGDREAEARLVLVR